MIWLVGIKYKSLEWPNGLARASRQSVRVAVRIPMSTRVAILGVNLLPCLRRNLFSAPPPPPPPTNVRLDEIELTLWKYLIQMDAIDRRFDELRNMFEHWDFTSLHKRMDAVDTLTKKADAFDRLQRLAY
jgi:hypothetical protein